MNSSEAQSILSDESLDRLTKNFLYDINVSLDAEYADPSRQLFECFWPAFPDFADLDISSAIVSSYATLESNTRANALAVVRCALNCCVADYLGLQRTLVVIDIAKQISPDALTPFVWSKLLARAADGDRPRWVGELGYRWSRWGTNLFFPIATWTEAINVVDIRRFVRFVGWALEQSAPDTMDSAKFAEKIFTIASRRLTRDSATFRDAGLDDIAAEELLEKRYSELATPAHSLSIDATNDAKYRQILWLTARNDSPSWPGGEYGLGAGGADVGLPQEFSEA